MVTDGRRLRTRRSRHIEVRHVLETTLVTRRTLPSTSMQTRPAAGDALLEVHCDAAYAAEQHPDMQSVGHARSKIHSLATPTVCTQQRCQGVVETLNLRRNLRRAGKMKNAAVDVGELFTHPHSPSRCSTLVLLKDSALMSRRNAWWKGL